MIEKSLDDATENNINQVELEDPSDAMVVEKGKKINDELANNTTIQEC